MAGASFGICGNDFVILASDMSAGRSIIKMKSDQNKIRKLGDSLGMCYDGEPGDADNFADYIERNFRLFSLRNDHDLSPQAAAAFTRRTLAESIRSRKPYIVQILLGGVDKATGKPHLYTMDPYGTLAKTDYSASGLGVYVSLSTMDRYWRPDLTREEAVDLMKRCVKEVQHRLAYQFAFNAVLVDKDGVNPVEI